MATNDKIYLETSDLESIASNLISKANTIKEQYTGDCYAALSDGSSCLEISGLDTTQLFDKLNTIYTNISERCTNLSNFLTNTIIPNYNSTSSAITQKFDTTVGEKISKLLGLTETTGTAAGATTAATGATEKATTSYQTGSGKRYPEHATYVHEDGTTEEKYFGLLTGSPTEYPGTKTETIAQEVTKRSEELMKKIEESVQKASEGEIQRTSPYINATMDTSSN